MPKKTEEEKKPTSIGDYFNKVAKVSFQAFRKKVQRDAFKAMSKDLHGLERDAGHIFSTTEKMEIHNVYIEKEIKKLLRRVKIAGTIGLSAFAIGTVGVKALPVGGDKVENVAIEKSLENEEKENVGDVLDEISAGAGRNEFIQGLKEKATLEGTETPELSENEKSDQVMEKLLTSYNEKYDTEYTLGDLKYFKTGPTNWLSIDDEGNYVYDSKETEYFNLENPWKIEENIGGANDIYSVLAQKPESQRVKDNDYEYHVIFSVGNVGNGEVRLINTRQVIRGSDHKEYSNMRVKDQKDFLRADDIQNTNLNEIYNAIKNEIERPKVAQKDEGR